MFNNLETDHKIVCIIFQTGEGWDVHTQKCRIRMLLSQLIYHRLDLVYRRETIGILLQVLNTPAFSTTYLQNISGNIWFSYNIRLKQPLMNRVVGSDLFAGNFSCVYLTHDHK